MAMTNLFKIENIPSEIWGVTLSELDRQNLSEGKTTTLLEGLVKEDGTIANGKLWLSYDEEKNIVVNCKYQNSTLFIPEEILGTKLTEAQRQKLALGETITINDKKNPTTISIDKELNCITISSGTNVRDIILSRINDKGFYELGGNKFSENEINDLLAGKQLKSKIFEENGKYFTAKISLTADNKGIVFTDVFELSKEHALKLKESTLPINTDKTNTIKHENISNNIENNKEKDLNKEQNTEITPKMGTKEQEFKDAIDNKDFDKIVSLKKEGFTVNNEHLNYIQTSQLESQEKKAIYDTFSIPGEKINALTGEITEKTSDVKADKGIKPDGLTEGSISPKVSPFESKDSKVDSRTAEKLNGLTHSVFDSM